MTLNRTAPGNRGVIRIKTGDAIIGLARLTNYDDVNNDVYLMEPGCDCCNAVEGSFLNVLNQMGMKDYTLRIWRGWQERNYSDLSAEWTLDLFPVDTRGIPGTMTEYAMSNLEPDQDGDSRGRYSNYYPIRFKLEERIYALNPVFSNHSEHNDSWILSSRTQRLENGGSWMVGNLQELLHSIGADYHREEIHNTWSHIGMSDHYQPVHLNLSAVTERGIVFPVERPTLHQSGTQYRGRVNPFRFRYYNGPIFSIANEPNRSELYLECSEGWGMKGDWDNIKSLFKFTDNQFHQLQNQWSNYRDRSRKIHLRLHAFPQEMPTSKTYEARRRVNNLLENVLGFFRLVEAPLDIADLQCRFPEHSKEEIQAVLDVLEKAELIAPALAPQDSVPQYATDKMDILRWIQEFIAGNEPEIVNDLDVKVLRFLLNSPNSVTFRNLVWEFVGSDLDTAEAMEKNDKLSATLDRLQARTLIRRWQDNGEFKFYTEPSKRNDIFALLNSEEVANGR